MTDDSDDRFGDADTPVYLTRLANKPPLFFKPDRLLFAVLSHAADRIGAPPAGGQYDTLKKRLIVKSNEKRLKRSFKACELGGKGTTITT